MEPVRPTPTTPASTRERLLDAAAELFYREGIGVGTDALCRAANVSKRSMYQLFGSKDEVMAASLERSAPAYQAFLLPTDDVREPGARILHVFERLEALATSPDYCGCPYVSITAELKSRQHPASVVARRYKDALTAFFQYEAERGGVADPVLLGKQLTIIFDGFSSRAVMQGTGVDSVATVTVMTLLDAAGLVKSADRQDDGDAEPPQRANG